MPEIMGRWKNIPFILLFILFLLSVVFHAPLHNGFSLVIKGPWYFIGLQEILHVVSGPTLVILGVLLILVMLYFFRYFGNKTKVGKSIFLVLIIAYLTFTFYWFCIQG